MHAYTNLDRLDVLRVTTCATITSCEFANMVGNHAHSSELRATNIRRNEQ